MAGGLIHDLDALITKLKEEIKEVRKQLRQTPYGMRHSEEYHDLDSKFKYLKKRLEFSRELKMLSDYEKGRPQREW